MSWLLDRVDRTSLALLLALASISVISVYSATHSREPAFWSGSGGKQLFYVAFALCVYLIVSKIDYHDWSDLAFLLYWIGIALLGLVLLTRPIAGARAWFELGPFRLQPSEPMKALVVLACASYLASTTARLDFLRLVRLSSE